MSTKNNVTVASSCPPAVDLSSLYPVVTDLTDVEYGCVGDSSCLTNFLPPPMAATNPAGPVVERCLMQMSSGAGGDDSARRRPRLIGRNSSGEVRIRSILAAAHPTPQSDSRRKLRRESPGRSSSTSSLSSRRSWTSSSRGEGSWTVEHSRSRTQQTEERFEDHYVLTRQIDKGTDSTVWECIHRTTGALYATKIIDRRSLSPPDDNAVYREADILRHLNSSSVADDSFGRSGIIRFVDFFDGPTHFFLVTTHVAGGDLFSRVIDRQCYNEDDARALAICILEALSFMHSRNVVHRDIKPENILLVTPGDDTKVKIADFGFAAILPPFCDDDSGAESDETVRAAGRKETKQGQLTGKCGTLSYISPEALSGRPYGTKTDMWSLGVVLYFVMGGYPPFVDHFSKHGLFKKILRGDFDFHGREWACVSRKGKDFISALLTVDPLERLSAEEALNHPWIIEGRKGKVCTESHRTDTDAQGVEHSCAFVDTKFATLRLQCSGRLIKGVKSKLWSVLAALRLCTSTAVANTKGKWNRNAGDDKSTCSKTMSVGSDGMMMEHGGQHTKGAVKTHDRSRAQTS